MAVRYVVEDNSWRGEVNVPRKEFGFNRLRYLWEHCPNLQKPQEYQNLL